ncbi:MAG: flagellar basal body L-ring protein FlgH [Parvularcula sp.]
MKIWGIAVALLASACASHRAAENGAAELASVEPPAANHPSAASLWNLDPESMFGNRRARAVGDILTVIVEIDETAELDNQVDRSRKTSEKFSAPAMFGLPEYAQNTLPAGATLNPGVDFNRDRQFQGAGSIKRKDRVTLRLAARVIDRLGNGDLVIQGRQEVQVNHETRILHAEGIVRPEDISRSNTIPHDRIAEAHIGYVGRGAIDRTVKPRIGNRLLDIIIPF